MADSVGRPYAGVYAGSGTTSPVAFGILTSERGDVAELIDPDGTPFAYASNDAYDNPGADAATGTAGVSAVLARSISDANVLRYAGYCYDGFSGLYYCSQRYYDPATAQFITKDPAKADGEESAYQYCGGDPVGKVDPSGEWSSTFSPRAYCDEWSYFLEVLMTNAGYTQQILLYFINKYGWLRGSGTFGKWPYAMVKPKGNWDFKESVPKTCRGSKVFWFGRTRISLDDWGNIHFGYIIASICDSSFFAKAGATAAGLWGSSSWKGFVQRAEHERINNWWIGYGYTKYRAYGSRFRAGNASQPNCYLRPSGIHWDWWLA